MSHSITHSCTQDGFCLRKVRYVWLGIEPSTFMSPAEQISAFYRSWIYGTLLKQNLVCFSVPSVFMERVVCYAPGLFAHARLYLCAPLTTASSCETAPRVRSSGVSSPRASQKKPLWLSTNVAESSWRVWDVFWETVSRETCAAWAVPHGR